MRKALLYCSYFLLMLAVSIILIELAFRLIVFRSGSGFDKIYTALASPDAMLPYASQPFLNYINNPGYKDDNGTVEVNSMGIRYPGEIALKKPDSTFRILFIGGSTTFGDVNDDFDVFPTLIEKELRKTWLPSAPLYNNVECLNGGAHGLTSAELLTHYQFKYQYLQPDMLVIHTGFNDGFTYVKIHDSNYQPDYHNSRRVFKDVPMLSPGERVFFHSRIFAFALIHFRFKDFLTNTLEDNIFFHHNNDKLWFKPGNSAIVDSNYNAFYNNLKTLIQVAQGRGATVVLVPEVCDSTKMPVNLRAKLPAALQINNTFIRELAGRMNVNYLSLPADKFTADLFLDDDGIHVNAKGEELKALYISAYLKDILPKGTVDHKQ